MFALRRSHLFLLPLQPTHSVCCCCNVTHSTQLPLSWSVGDTKCAQDGVQLSMEKVKGTLWSWVTTTYGRSTWKKSNESAKQFMKQSWDEPARKGRPVFRKECEWERSSGGPDLETERVPERHQGMGVGWAFWLGDLKCLKLHLTTSSHIHLLFHRYSLKINPVSSLLLSVLTVSRTKPQSMLPFRFH